MGRDHNDDRRRALVKGKFKFLYQDDAEDIESTNKFELAVVQNKLLGPVKYMDKDGKDPDVLRIYGQERKEGEGYANPEVNFPGILDLFTVVWSNPFGDIFVESDIKLFEFKDIQKYSTYNDGPESREFCRFYSSRSSRELDGFDSSIFWSAGFLWKHFRTCGVEAWDIQLKNLIDHYKNWKSWTHEVHNLPNTNNNTNKQNVSKKYSDNMYSGPASTSTSYSRDRDPRDFRDERDKVNVNNNSNKSNPSLASSSSSSGVLSAPCPGQTVMVPIPGPDGNIVHVQLSTVIPPAPVPGPSHVQPPQPRYKYVNPQLLIPNVPPPNHPNAGYSWRSQVDDFLSGPSTRSCSPVTSKLQSIEKRPFSPTKDTSTPVKKKSKFTPKAQILPPSPRGDVDDVNELDIRPDWKSYSGEIIDWRGKFGFLNCGDISGKIFLHSKDIENGRSGVKVGSRAEFQVLHRDSSVVGAKAVNVKIIDMDISENL